ncbi:MAG TPA: ribulose-phosphate 3-epimerase [Bacillota bacterium]|nr:ribulose-phosphate 3-epimerase [Bacillota bacterium]
MIEIAPSFLNSDFLNLEREISKVSNADWLHCDIMDGHFVPNLTFGPMVVSALKKVTRLPLEAHLMVEKPEIFIPLYAQAGCRRIIVQVETSLHLQRLLQQIREFGCEAGVALNPATTLSYLEYVLEEVDLVLIMTVNPGFGGQKLLPSVIPKIRKLREMIDSHGYSCKLEVDGGVTWENAQTLVKAGVNVIVAGTLIYQDPNPGQAITRLKNILEEVKGGN